jgi:hypothetical protein
MSGILYRLPGKEATTREDFHGRILQRRMYVCAVANALGSRSLYSSLNKATKQKKEDKDEFEENVRKFMEERDQKDKKNTRDERRRCDDGRCNTCFPTCLYVCA